MIALRQADHAVGERLDALMDFHILLRLPPGLIPAGEDEDEPYVPVGSPALDDGHRREGVEAAGAPARNVVTPRPWR